MGTSPAQKTYRRRRLIVYPAFQYRFIGILLLVLMLMTVGALASVYLSLWMTLQTFDMVGEPLAVAQLSTVGLLVTVQLLALAPVVIWIGMRLTHKVAGPLVRINAALQQMAQGDFNVRLKLRHGDALVEVADAINKLASVLQSRRS